MGKGGQGEAGSGSGALRPEAFGNSSVCDQIICVIHRLSQGHRKSLFSALSQHQDLHSDLGAPEWAGRGPKGHPGPCVCCRPPVSLWTVSYNGIQPAPRRVLLTHDLPWRVLPPTTS